MNCIKCASNKTILEINYYLGITLLNFTYLIGGLHIIKNIEK